MAEKITYLALDCGKANTKLAISSDKHDNVGIAVNPTKVREETNRNKILDPTYTTIEYDGKLYVLNEEKSITNLESDSKKDYFAQVMALWAIAKYVENNSKVHVFINCPYRDALDKTKRDEFKNFILPTGEINVTINGAQKKYEILTVTVYPEAASAASYLSRTEGKPFGIIDIGGLNSTFAYYDKQGARQDEMCGMTRQGILKAAKKAREEISSLCDDEFTIEEILDGFKNGEMQGYPEYDTKSIIDGKLNLIISTIKSDCESKMWKFRMCDLYIIGGGSILLKDRLSKEFPTAQFIENAEYINVLGLMKLMRLKNGLSESFVVNKLN